MKQGEAQQGDAKQAAAERDAATARRDEAIGPDEGRPNDSKALGFDGTRRSHSMHEAGIDGNGQSAKMAEMSSSRAEAA